MSRAQQSKMRRMRADSRAKLLAGVAAAAALAAFPGMAAMAQTPGAGTDSSAAGASSTTTAPGTTGTGTVSTDQTAGATASGAGDSSATGAASSTDSSAAGQTGTNTTDSSTGTTTTGSPSDTTGSTSTSTGTAPGDASGTAGTNPTDTTGAGTMGTDNTGASTTTPGGTNTTATPTGTDTTGATPSTPATTPDMSSAPATTPDMSTTPPDTSGGGMAPMPDSSMGGMTPMSGSSISGGGMSDMGGSINYKLLSNPNISYAAIQRAKAYGLGPGQIAQGYALSKAADVPFSVVLSQVEDGYTYPTLAQQYGVSLKTVYASDKYKSMLADYVTAYKATGSGAMKAMKSGMMMSGNDMSMTNGTGGTGAMPMTSPMTSDNSTNTSAMTPTTTGSQTITDVLRSDGRFTRLAAAITAAGLDDYLRGAGPFTLFAPTDAAFAKLPQDQLNALLQNPAQLSQVLQYHLILHKVGSTDIAAMTSPTVATAQGGALNITSAGGNVMVNGATVTQADIPASNGVIHAIDTVLMPPAMTGGSSTPSVNAATPAAAAPTPGS